MAYTNRNFMWDFDALKRFYEKYIVKWINSPVSWTDTQKKQARANLGLGNGNIDSEPTAGSNNLITSDAVNNAVNSKASQSDLTTLNGKVSTLETAVGSGGVDSRIAAAKTEIKGTATSACDTLGEAEAKINANTTAISNEVTRAEAAEEALDGRVDTLEDTVGSGGSVDSRISAAIATETTRAQGAESTLQTNIDTEATRAQTAESALNSGKADKATTLAGYGITNAYTKSETYTKTEVNGLVDTPHQEYVTVQATSQTTATTDVLPASGQAADTIYRVSNWDGSANSGAGGYDVTKYSEYAWDDVSTPNKYVFLCVKSQIDEVFDISVYNNNAVYADLSAALGTNGANVPESLRKGGMSVKFIQGSVQSSDNNYVQFQCIADEFTTDVTKWRGVDKIPTKNSINYVESGGVVIGIEQELAKIADEKKSKNLFNKSDIIDGYIINNLGELQNYPSFTYNKTTGLIPVKPNYYYMVSGNNLTSAWNIRCLAADGITVMKVLAPSNNAEYTKYNMPNSDGTGAANTLNAQFKTPANAAYVQFNIGANKIDSTNTAMIEEVGSIYNPDFVPSEYEPYIEPYVIVKPEAIDMDKTPVEDSEKPITSGGVYKALNKKLSVLLIGSSHGVNTIRMFPVLAYHAGIDVIVGNLYTGSATLGLYSERPERQIPYMADHDVAFMRFAVYENGAWSNKRTATISYALSEYQWDAIILQRGATEDYWNESISNFYQHLLDYIKEHCVDYVPKIYFNSGIADASKTVKRTDQIANTNTLINTAKQQKAEYGIDIIPTAVAVQYARMTCLKETGYGWVSSGTTYHDMSSDSQHLDIGIGQYVTGCTVFEKIVGDFFNMSIRELSYYPVYNDVSGGGVNEGSQYFTPITDYYSRIAKQCAMIAVMDGEYVAEHAAALTSKYAFLPTTYTITNTLAGCTNSNDAINISSDEVYMATLNVNTGLTMQSVEVTMGGVDVTSSVYAAYEGYYAIRIGVITGDIIITASAS